MDDSDQTLLREFLRGQEQAFRDLSDRHMNLVYGVAMRNTSDPSVAEEVVQDVFVLLATKARQLLKHPSIAGWLHNTARNVAHDARRKRIGHQKKLEHFAEESSSNNETPPLEHLDEIDTAVDSLPANEREAILLRFFEDQDYHEIAQRLSISEPTARKRVSRGIKRLHSGLQTKLAAGSALALLAPAHLSEAVTSTATSTLIMTKTTISIACVSALITGLAFFAIEQNGQRKQLVSELVALRQDLPTQRGKLTALSGSSSPASSTGKKRIKELEEELEMERGKRLLAEKDAAAVRKATADLEDQIVLAYGKVEEVGSDFGSIFMEALALSELEKAGELDNPEAQKRLVNFSIKATSISGLSTQIIQFDNEPEEGSKFFSATYKEIFGLDDRSTKALQQVFAEEITIAREKELTLVNNPARKAIESGETFDPEEVNTWLASRQEYYRGVRSRLREQISAEHHADFDRLVEEDGIGFQNISLGGTPLGFSLGGKQAKPEKEEN